MGAVQAPEPRKGYRAKRRPAESADLSDRPEESESSEEEEDDEEGPPTNPFEDDLLPEQRATNPFTDDVLTERKAKTIDYHTRVWAGSQGATLSSPTYRDTHKASPPSSCDGSTEEEEEEEEEQKQQQESASRGWWPQVGICLTDSMPEVDTSSSRAPREVVSVGKAAKFSASFGRWSQFTAETARGRAQKAQRKEMEYVLKCIARESARPSTSMNVLCSNQDQYELLIHELRARQFVVSNPVRAMYEEKTQRLLELEGRIALPEVPMGDLRQEWLLRDLYHNPAHAELQYALHVGTFKIFVHASLDQGKAKDQEAYFFSDGKNSHHHHYKDASLLLKVQW